MLPFGSHRVDMLTSIASQPRNGRSAECPAERDDRPAGAMMMDDTGHWDWDRIIDAIALLIGCLVIL